MEEVRDAASALGEVRCGVPVPSKDPGMPKPKPLVFPPRLAALIRSGTKTSAWRLYDADSVLRGDALEL